MKKIILIGLIFVLLFITGCCDNPKGLEETLLCELQMCENKFSDPNANLVYCSRILEEIRKYEEQGIIQIDENLEILEELENKDIAIITTEEKEVDKAINAIIGDI